ncbi:YidC/Oxa1 family membrane protein insertase [Candidatus Saccharibacteria bacterium]|nr:YidC/Oxa1 family membrane protein insertase [Candidatus Saccharibacteria bacterium]
MWSLIVELWNTLIFEPVFNLIAILIAIIPWHNFGLALVLFAVITRLLLHPLIKKQLLQIKKQKELQPEVMKIKKANKGNRQQETMEIMALYRKNNFNPFAALGYILLQIPILIGLYQVINRVATDNQILATDSYSFVRDNAGWLEELHENPEIFDPTLFGTVDLTKPAFSGAGALYETIDISEEGSPAIGDTSQNGLLRLEDRSDEQFLFGVVREDRVQDMDYAVVAVEEDCVRLSAAESRFQTLADDQIAIERDGNANSKYLCLRVERDSELYLGALAVVIATAVVQFFTSKQMIALGADKKKGLRQIFKEQAEGKDVDQSEVSAAMNRTFLYIFPAIIFVFSIGLFAALPFYWLINSLAQYFQQKRLDSQDGGGVKAKVDGQDVAVTVEKRLNAKEKKEQAATGRGSASGRRNVKRVAATSRTINRKDDKKE